jgi:hypothetical protein
MIRVNRRAALVVMLSFAGLLAAGHLAADDKLFGIACRSVHLAYQAPPSVAFYNEVEVQRSAPGTYFCVCGFQMGYFGIQELADSRKVVIFSVWDPGDENDPNRVANEARVQVLHQGEGVRIGRFGNEGTGAQSFFDLDWKPGQRLRFLVTSRPDGERTAFTARVFLPEQNDWKHLATFSTLASGASIQGQYAFIEDFRRNRESANQARAASFGPGFIRDARGDWQPLAKARFTADSNPDTRIDAGLSGQQFRLATGGTTRNQGTKLRELLPEPIGPLVVPDDLEPLVSSPEQAPEEASSSQP